MTRRPPARGRARVPAGKPAAPPALEQARARLARGALDEARRLAEQVLARNPRSAGAMEVVGIVHLQQGRPQEALEHFASVAEAQPRNLAALGNLCAVQVSLRRHAEALRTVEAMLALDPRSASALVSRGVTLHALGRSDEALASYEAAIALEPGNADAHNNAGTILGALGRQAEALARYERALAERPDFPEALNNRGVALAALDRADEAVASYARACELRPAYLDARKNLAELLAKLGRNDEALAAYDAALPLAPRLAELHSNRGTVLNALNRHAEALEGYDRALALKPDFPDAINNRGITLNALNRFDEALACFRRAIELKPDYANAHWNLSLTLLRMGRFEEGWQEHEWRWHKPEFAPHKIDLPQPLWLGKEDLAGKTILLRAEQGFGDTLQFCRYAALLEARGARVLLFVPEPLVPLLRHCFPRAVVFSRTDAFPPFDFQCPLLSLPLAFGTLAETVPALPGYLRAPPGPARDWAGRIGPAPGPRVGVVWSGSATHKNDVNRTIPLELFGALFSVPGVRFYSLQKELGDEEAARLAALGVASIGTGFGDFADTAGAIAALDLVVTVDTSVAHLAAAMGKPTWILLPFVSDWRWLPGQPRSAWYPSARLYWQKGIGQWEEAIGRVRRDLAAFRVPAPDAAPAPAAIGLEDAVGHATAFLRAGNLADAQAVARGVLQLQPDNPDALAVLGSVRLQQQRGTEAVELFQRVVARRPQAVEAALNLAGAMRLAGRHEEALLEYDRAIALAPGNPNAHTNRGISLIALKRYDEALAAADRALAIDPANLPALNNRGVVLNEMLRHDEALATFERALAAKPDYLDALNNRGLALLALNRPADAERNYRQALALRPDYADAINNLGLALASLGRNAEAIGCFHRAQALKPGYVDAHWNESLINLLLGNYREGWAQYEWRWKKPEFAPHNRAFHVPRWTGTEPLEGRTIFVHFEQGLGDTIQFMRYLEPLLVRGARVLASVPESLRELMRESFPRAAFYCGQEVLPPFDFHAPLLSLPLAFGTSVETIPAKPAYLRAPAARMEKWRARLGARDRPRVGLAWAGNPKHRNDRNRSLPAAAVVSLLRRDCRFYALQRDLRAEDEAVLRDAPVELLGAELADFSDTAAAILQMDLVIAVDTSVAHLAGALGKPVWVLLPFAPDWRWLVGREDSPWYPTARLFRQPDVGAVEALVASVREALDAFAAGALPRPAKGR